MKPTVSVEVPRIASAHLSGPAGRVTGFPATWMTLGSALIWSRPMRVWKPAASSLPLMKLVTESIVRGVEPISDRSIGTAVVWVESPTGTLMVMLNLVSPSKAFTGVSSAPSWIGPVIELELSRGTPAVVLEVEDDVPCTMRSASNSALPR